MPNEDAAAIRLAVEADIPALLPLMRGLAEFEKYADIFAVTESVKSPRDRPIAHTTHREAVRSMSGGSAISNRTLRVLSYNPTRACVGYHPMSQLGAFPAGRHRECVGAERD